MEVSLSSYLHNISNMKEGGIITGWTHLGAGVLTGIYLGNSIIYTSSIREKVIICGLSGLSSILADIDTEYSLINKILGTGKLSFMFGKHRTFTHSIWGICGVIVLSSFFSQNLAIAIVVGYCMHIFMDSFTFSRIQLFYPSKQKYGIGVIKSGKEEDTFLGILIWAMVIYLVFNAKINFQLN